MGIFCKNLGLLWQNCGSSVPAFSFGIISSSPFSFFLTPGIVLIVAEILSSYPYQPTVQLAAVVDREHCSGSRFFWNPHRFVSGSGVQPVYDRMSGSGPVYRKFPAFFYVRFRFSGTGHLPANRTFA